MPSMATVELSSDIPVLKIKLIVKNNQVIYFNRVKLKKLLSWVATLVHVSRAFGENNLCSGRSAILGNSGEGLECFEGR